jgi:hypothetical protein
MAYGRDDRGVLVRSDGKGDAWANLHRSHLDDRYFMIDFDGWQVCEPSMEHGENTEDHLFAEVVPDGKKGQAIRNYRYVALFDRKATVSAMQHAWFTQPVYLHMCRVFTGYQSQRCRFIYVIGGQTPPWTLQEVDIYHGTFGVPVRLDAQKESWVRIWASIGLTGVRLQFEHELRTYPQQKKGDA